MRAASLGSAMSSAMSDEQEVTMVESLVAELTLAETRGAEKA